MDQMTKAWRVPVPWWKRRKVWLLVGVLVAHILLEVDVARAGLLHGWFLWAADGLHGIVTGLYRLCKTLTFPFMLEFLLIGIYLKRPEKPRLVSREEHEGPDGHDGTHPDDRTRELRAAGAKRPPEDGTETGFPTWRKDQT